MMEPVFNPKFGEWEILWKSHDGRFCGAWGETKEKCLERYEYSQIN